MKNKKLIMVIAVVVAVLAIVVGVRAYEKKNQYVGYYYSEPVNTSEMFSDLPTPCAMHIAKDGTVIYMRGRKVYASGYLEKEEGRGVIYFDKFSFDAAEKVQPSCPLYLEKSDNGNRVYLTSDNSNWNTRTFESVNKSEYETIIEENDMMTSAE